MSDDTMSEESTAPSSAGSDTPRPARPARPAAAAASRARRIGGGVPTPRPSARPDAGEDERGASEAPPVTKSTATATSLVKSPVASASGDATVPPRAVVTEIPGWLKWVPAAVLGAVALVMVIVVAVASHGVWWSTSSTGAIRDRVVAAAKSCTAATNSYKYTAIDAAEAGGMKCTSGAYQGQYKKAMDTLIKKNAPKLKFTQTAQINDAGVVSVTPSGNQWSVLVFGQLSITSTQTGKGGRVDPFAAIVQMGNVGGKWLIVKIAPVTAVTG